MGVRRCMPPRTMTQDSSPKPDPPFEDLFAEYEVAFRAYARSMLPSWDAVDEVLQSASLIMWRKLDEVDIPKGFLPWGKCIVRFEVQKYRRSKARDRHVFEPELIELLAKHQEEADDVDLDKERRALDDCLSEVSDASRELVLAPYREHGYITNLAEASGRTRNSLYKQIRRIRGKLEDCVEQKLEGYATEG